jgi:hypothetical protein
MRRLVIMGALVALLVGVFASVAYARTFTCTDLPCYGTDNPDVINERPAAGTPDEIFGLRGRDIIDAGISFVDEDILWGNRAQDTLYTDDGDDLDEAHGGAGEDTCYVDVGDAAFSCEHLIHVT